jgi:hypothetical protein
LSRIEPRRELHRCYEGDEKALIYADTSFLVAVKVRRDNFHVVAADYYSDNQEAPWL